MYARVNTFEGDPDLLDASITSVREEIIPTMRQVDGFQGLYVLADRATGATIAITLWESEAALRASEETANTVRTDAASRFGERIVSVERYEVVATPSS
jgi:heme-degrading monooxygenase HmoA